MIFRNAEQGAHYVAERVVTLINTHNNKKPFVLGLTTGQTPQGVYRELLSLYRAGKVSFANVAVFSLDEFFPISPEAHQSRNFRIREELLSHTDIKAANIHFPDGRLPIAQVAQFCKEYEERRRPGAWPWAY